MPDTDRASEHRSTYEKRDVRALPVYLYGGILLLLVALSGLFVDWLFQRLKHAADADQKPVPAAALRANVPQTPSPPAFSMYPARNLAEFRRAEDEFLRSYGWVDGQSATARIPLQRAMDLLVEHGLPAVPPAVVAGEKKP